MRILGKAVFAGVVVLILASVPPAVSGQDKWEYLGSAHVDGDTDHDNIKVGVQDGMFHAIQLRVKGGAIEFSRVVVHYGNGEPEEVSVRERIRAGGRTRAIQLQGHQRYLKSVELWYGRGGWKERPEVQLYGMR